MNDTQYKNFEDFFEKATGFKPYPYQQKFAESDVPAILNIPTGTGKTEAAILVLWLWKRLNNDTVPKRLNNDTVPKRLIYCLPMRVLVEQTKNRVEGWLKNLGLEERISVEQIMGGSEDEVKKINPNKECIIIGTQDMLISGALNRAYGNSPALWPIIFGLLNNDCMWILDEVQIMENALPTSIQMNHFRNSLKTYGPHKTIWMSATINPKWMETVDSPKGTLQVYKLGKADENDNLKKRNNAAKTLRKAPITLKKAYDKKDIEKMAELHKDGTVTAIMVNNVKRAQKLYHDLTETKSIKDRKINCLLIHSRFRAADRRELNTRINEIRGKDGNSKDNTIIISTQVLEAGVDISVRTMLTELAPWPSLVQRFGRCNRYGEMMNADVYWMDLVDKKLYLPYDEKDLEQARDKLDLLKDKSISPSKLPAVEEEKLFDAVLRNRDIVNLFDTTPDMSGNHTDVSRFVRSIDQRLDVGVFWRNDTEGNNSGQAKPKRDEICSVSKFDLEAFLKKGNRHGHVWSFVNRKYERVYHKSLYPGQTVMLNSKMGGYSNTQGWNADTTESVKPVELAEKPQQTADSHDDDHESKSEIPVTLCDHTKHVLDEVNFFLKDMTHLDKDIKEAICTAAKYHDVGKNHSIFQDTMKRGIIDKNKAESEIWAKSEKMSKHSVPGFRHEVASALAYLQQKDIPSKELKNLIAYLIMSHHGKVRLSLRNHYKSNQADQDEKRLLGFKLQGDVLPEFSCGDVSIKKTDIDMSLASIGQDKSGNSSWTELAVTLRNRYGPFRLAYLETVIRKADWLASAKESEGKY